jgi:hypothetical protein
MRIRSNVGALFLIAVGCLLLASNMGYLPRLGPLFHQWWPLILVIIGASMLFRR